MWVGPPHGEERRLLSDGGKSRGCALGNSGRSVYRSSVGARGRCPKHWFGRDAMEQEVPVSRGSVRTRGDAQNIGPAATPWNRKCSFRVAPGVRKTRQEWVTPVSAAALETCLRDPLGRSILAARKCRTHLEEMGSRATWGNR